MTQNTDKLGLAVNHALNEVQMARLRMQRAGLTQGLDSKRTAAWCEYGFKEALEFQDFFNLYRRGGIAHGAVEKIVTTCWRTYPTLIEGDEQDNAKKETAWERGNKPLFRRGAFWRALAVADRRRLIGKFSGVLIQLKDSRRWDEPVTSAAALVKLIPVWASALKVKDSDTDPQSPTYGEPKMWEYTEAGDGGRGGRKIDVHPDRVFILGDRSADAIAFLEPAYNAFVSLEKVEGGSGESFLKNAARQVSVDFDKDVNLAAIASAYGVGVVELQERFNEAAREINRGNDAMLVTQGAKVQPLVAQVADPEPTYNVNLQTAGAAVDIPTKILVGMQTGERASTEDQKYMNGRCQARRNDLSFELAPLFDQLIRIKVMKPIADFAVVWDDLTEAAPADKLASAKTMSEINAQAISTGELVFTNDEIREVAGYDPLEGGPPLPDNDEDEEEDAARRDPAG